MCSFSSVLNDHANRANAGASLIREQWHVVLFLPLVLIHSFERCFQKKQSHLGDLFLVGINFGIFLMSSTTSWIIFWNISNYLPVWLAIHQDTHPHGPANILFWIFMECIHGYLGCSPPVLEYYLILFGNDSNYLDCLPPPHRPKARI